jgi:hypothetical protein
MCQEECPEGLVRSFAVEVEEGNAYWESLNGVGADDRRLSRMKCFQKKICD